MTYTTEITVRPATRKDLFSLRRLAALDSAEVPAGKLLVAEADGELIAALSTGSGRAIADPFRPSLAAVEMLRLRASQLPAAA